MIEVIKSGLYSSIQDCGRFGFENYGVPNSGAMDQFSALLSNELIGNKADDSVMEITMTGPLLKFHKKTIVSITGADISPSINNRSVKINSSYLLNKNDTLSFGKLNYGFRSYIAVVGGFKTKRILNSRSMYINITGSFRINDGDLLKTKETIKKRNLNPLKFEYKKHFNSLIIDVYKGPEFDLLNKTEKNLLFSNEFNISNLNNRMAYQLKENLNNKIKPIISSIVIQGTVQLTPSGKIIILMRDNQTSGGYPRILQLSNDSINRLSQKHMGNKIKFNLIEY
tara:strand:+ start:580 stop:1428 length:849 start_codon:yes stop_codon:yes gene_type:complete